MEGAKKLEINSGKEMTSSTQLIPNATYKPIPEDEMEEKPLTRPKSLAKSASNASETDRADEKMLPDEDRKVGSNSNINVADVKFTKVDKQNGDAKLDIGEVKSGYVGLGKEELLRYANDPFWVRLRWFLFISFWLLWAGMLVGAVMIIIAAPKCVPPAPKTWWESGPLVELPSSPTAAQLSALAGQGATGVIASLDGDASPEDYDAFSMDPSILDEIASKVAAAKLRLILDVDVLYSPRWFDKSERKDEGFEDYYVWADGKGFNASGDPSLPNNWLNPDDSPSWLYSTIRRQFYLANALHQPQLNYRSPSVISHARTLLHSLSTLGMLNATSTSAAGSQSLSTTSPADVAGGVRLRNVPRLLVDVSLADEEPVPISGSDYTIGQYGFYAHRRVENLPEVADVLVQLRKGPTPKMTEVGKEQAEDDGGGVHEHVFMLYEQLTTLEPFQFNGSLLIDLPQQSKAFRPERLARSDSVASQLKTDLTGALNMMEGHYWPAWKVQNTQFPADVINMVTFLLPGVPILNASDIWDPTLIELRKSASIMYGSCNFYEVANQTTFVYIRVHSGNPGFIVAFNPTNEPVVVNFPLEIPVVADEVTVQMVSANYNETGVELNLKSSAQNFPISSNSAVILSYVPKSK